MRTIKRYANRKLYDTTDSKYVTLGDIGALVRAGEAVSVLDNRNKEDITGQTLALVIASELTGGTKQNYSVAALSALIKGGPVTQEILARASEQLASVKAEATQALEDATVKTGAALDFGS